MNGSNIRVSRETKSRLKGLGLTQHESYNNIILRLLDVKLDGREIDYLISDKKSNHKLKVKVDWSKETENLLYYNPSNNELTFDQPSLNTKNETNLYKWDNFLEYINSLDNFFNILAVLDEDESIEAGDITIKRLSTK